MNKEQNDPRRWAWITGWGIDPEVFATAARECWPRDQHVVFAPDRDAVGRLRAERADVLAGYSLGALLLLAAEPWPEDRPLVAVAPILAFDAEAGLGGKTPAAARVSMRGKFDANPSGQLRLFRRLAGLGGLTTDPLPYAAEELAWGLDALGGLRADAVNVRRARLYAGARDPLVAAERLCEHADLVRVAAEAGHDFRQLLPFAARHE
jgi:hypothetical protein